MTRDLVRAALTADDQLDDIKRARIWNALEDRLAEPAPRRARWPFALALAGAAAAALAIVLVTRTAEPRLIAVERDTTLMSPIGPHTRAALVGPAELEVVGTPAEQTVVRLRAGTLLADFAGGAGRSLRIEAPGATIDVVGTLFAVEVRGGATCVSVSHGTVRVTTPSAPPVLVERGHTHCTDTGARPIEPAIDGALRDHERVITARADQPAPSESANLPKPAVEDLPKLAAEGQGLEDLPGKRPEASRKHPAPSRVAIGEALEGARIPHPAPEPARPTQPAVTELPAPIAPPSPAPQRITTPPSVPPRIEPAIAPPSVPSPAPQRIAPPSPQRITPSSLPPRVEPAITPPATPPRVEPAITPPRPSADELYRVAESALVARDHAAADRALDRLVTEYPSSPLVESALYERARIAHGKRAWGTARRHLDRLLALPAPRLAEPARYLACRIAVEARDGEAAACLVEYRKAYPRSPHDRDVLGLLAQLASASGGCAAAAPYVDELERRYPRASLAIAWRARCAKAVPR